MNQLKIMKAHAFILFILLGLVSCSTTSDPKIDNNYLIGTWQWQRTDGGIAFQIHATPENTGKTVLLILKGNYNYTIIENGNEVSKGRYQLNIKHSIYSGSRERFISYSNDNQLNAVVISGVVRLTDMNHLEIDDNNADGSGSGFIKIK